MKPWKINSGYLVVKLWEDGKPQTFLVHRLIALEHCEGYQEGLDVNHKDGDRTNNQASNLEWVTRKENIHDTIKRGTHNVTSAQEVAKEKNKRPVIGTCIHTGKEIEFESIKDVKIYFKSGVNIVRAIKHDYTCKGHKWRYK